MKSQVKNIDNVSPFNWDLVFVLIAISAGLVAFIGGTTAFGIVGQVVFLVFSVFFLLTLVVVKLRPRN